MLTFDEWSQAFPEAAQALGYVLGAVPWPVIPSGGDGKSEAWAQQQIRFSVARQGAYSWRNNVGATPAKCRECGAQQQPVRYGLANDSEKLNQEIKSGDLILAIPRIIRPEDVGRTIAQFGSIEAKEPGWVFSGTKREKGQAAWATLINKIGGFARFSTGEINLYETN
jgi:hypothetical protein